jgi:hypothetical protein
VLSALRTLEDGEAKKTPGSPISAPRRWFPWAGNHSRKRKGEQ